MLRIYDRIVAVLSSAIAENIMLVFVRLSFAGIFWRSGRAKIEEGTWFTISDGTWELFDTEFSGVPLPSEIAAPLATAAEHVFPVLLVIGLSTRISSLALLIMTLVIQIYVYPDAWWSVHSLWVALGLVLMAKGGGRYALDHVFNQHRHAR